MGRITYNGALPSFGDEGPCVPYCRYVKPGQMGRNYGGRDTLSNYGAIHPMVDEELLKILVCPENKTAVSLVEQATIDRINEAIASKTLKNRGEEDVEQPIEGGLLRADGAYLYIIREDIPVMLIDEAIPMAQLG